MIKFIIARTKEDEETYNKYLGSSIKNIQSKSFEVYDTEEKLSIFQKYNMGIDAVLQEESFDESDIICFIHNDVKIVDPYFETKIQTIFNRKVQVGLLGVIGALSWSENGMWWANLPDFLRGHIIQEVTGDLAEKANSKEIHLLKGSIGYFENAVVVDGLFMAIRAKILKDGMRFDEKFNGFDLYDINFCIDLLIKTDWKIAITDILLLHRSVGLGSISQSFKDTKEKTINKYKEIGLEFPLSIESIQSWKEKKLNG